MGRASLCLVPAESVGELCSACGTRAFCSTLLSAHEAVTKLFFRPRGASSFPIFPRACALGCILTPLRGFPGSGSVHFRNWESSFITASHALGWANEFRRSAAWSSESLTTVLTKIEFSDRDAVPGLPYADTACRDFYVLTVLIHPWVLTRLGRPLLPGWATPHPSRSANFRVAHAGFQQSSAMSRLETAESRRNAVITDF